MIKTILTAWKEARQVRQLIAIADRAEFWTPLDGEYLVRFMVTAPGQKLRARLNNMVYKSMLQACSSESNGDYRRGVARGVLLTVAALDQHMDAARQPQEKDFAGSHGVNGDTSGLAERALR